MSSRAVATLLIALPFAARASSTSSGECGSDNQPPLAAAAAITELAANESAVAKALRAAAKSGKVPKDLLITYDDIDSLHGGIRLELRGDGRARRMELKHGGMKPEISLRPVPHTELVELVRELVEIEAWKQKTPV